MQLQWSLVNIVLLCKRSQLLSVFRYDDANMIIHLQTGDHGKQISELPVHSKLIFLAILFTDTKNIRSFLEKQKLLNV